MIALEQVAARRAPLALSSVSLSWGPGVHAAVGNAGDGGSLLLAVAAGAARPRSGRVRVLDGTPSDPRVRARIAYVPLDPPLPDGLRVGELLALAAALRREPAKAAAERLAAFGLEALEGRPIATLAREEARAVALAEAVTSAAVRVLLVDEPLVAVDPRAAVALGPALRARAGEGCTVVIATASVRDACELADDHVRLRAGTVVGRGPALEAIAGGAAAYGARLRMFVDDPRRLAAELARDEAVRALARGDGSLVARGRDPIELSRAAARAILESGVNVTELRFEPAAGEEAPPPHDREAP